MAKGVGALCCTLGLPIPSKAWLPFSSILASWMFRNLVGVVAH